MFIEILGLIIDKDGNYLSFGKHLWDYAEACENIYFHGRSFLMALKNSEWVKQCNDFDMLKKHYVDLEVFEKSKDLDSLFYVYANRLSYQGYLTILNGTFFKEEPLMSGYAPEILSYPQEQTLIQLKDFLLETEFFKTEFFLSNSTNIFTITDIYQNIEKNINKRIREIE